MKILWWLWQLPQHLLGLILVKALKAKKRFLRVSYCGDAECGLIEYWLFERGTKFSRFISGVSLGKYILLAPDNSGETTVRHEHGHSIQSKYLGWFYLLAIGVPSALGNLLHRIFRFDYYKQPWEAWADRLAGLVRKY